MKNLTPFFVLFFAVAILSIAGCSGELDAAKAQVEQLTAEVEQLSTELKTTQAKLEDQTTENEILESQVNTHKYQLGQTANEFLNVESAYNEQTAIMQDRIATMKLMLQDYMPREELEGSEKSQEVLAEVAVAEITEDAPGPLGFEPSGEEKTTETSLDIEPNSTDKEESKESATTEKVSDEPVVASEPTKTVDESAEETAAEGSNAKAPAIEAPTNNVSANEASADAPKESKTESTEMIKEVEGELVPTKSGESN